MIEVCLLLTTYNIFVNFRVSALQLTASFIIVPSMWNWACLCVCVWEREEEGGIVLADPTL